MAIKRGEVYAYNLPNVLPREGRSTKRLIITSDELNAYPEQMLMVGLQVRDSDPGGLLAVKIGDEGWASVIHIERLLPSALGELLYTATADEIDDVASSMRAAYELWPE